MDDLIYTAEFEFRASRRVLYPYINTPSGLSQWFADDVTVDQDKVFTFAWNGERARAQRVVQRANRMVRFEFLDDPGAAQSSQTARPSVEIRLEENDLTGAVFLSVTDSVSADSEEEFGPLWNQMVDTLREIVGG
ncbi:MAG: START-like domain-containing protein [Tunicatimonas sp.]